MENLFLCLLAFLALIPALAVLAFFAFLREMIADWRARRFNTIHRFNPDRNGNYPVYYDPRSGTFYSPAPGNTPYAPYIYVYNGQPKEIKRQREEQPLAIYSPYPIARREGEIVPEQCIEQNEQPVPTEQFAQPEQLPEPDSNLQELIELLRQAKEGKRPKSRAIPEITGISRGGSPKWDFWSNTWDNL